MKTNFAETLADWTIGSVKLEDITQVYNLQWQSYIWLAFIRNKTTKELLDIPAGSFITGVHNQKSWKALCDKQA